MRNFPTRNPTLDCYGFLNFYQFADYLNLTEKSIMVTVIESTTNREKQFAILLADKRIGTLALCTK